MTATFVPAGEGIALRWGNTWDVKQNGKTIAHIRQTPEGWRVHRTDRNGRSGLYPSAEKAALFFGFRISEWIK